MWTTLKNTAYRMDETAFLKQLLELINFTPAIERSVGQCPEKLVIAVRRTVVREAMKFMSECFVF